MPDFNKKYLAALVGAVLVIVAVFVILARQPQKLDSDAAAREQARQDVQRMIEEDMAAAKAQADFNAMMRQAELEAADNILNAVTGEQNVAEPLPLDELPSPETNGQSEEPDEPAQSNVLSRDIYLRGKSKQEAGAGGD